MNFLTGEYIYINKPYGMTSFGALAYVRTRISRKVGVKRVKTGHAGTLDPLATGVLILCTGKKTKEIERLQLHDKEYTATLQLGSTTPSYDLEHEVDQTYPTEHITRELIEEVLTSFVGDIQQVPPQYSACKIGGDRAYELKRKGKEVQLAAKTIHISELELTDFQPKTMQMSHLTALCRTRLGSVRIEDCITIDNFSAWLDQQEIEELSYHNNEIQK